MTSTTQGPQRFRISEFVRVTNVTVGDWYGSVVRDDGGTFVEVLRVGHVRLGPQKVARERVTRLGS